MIGDKSPFHSEPLSECGRSRQSSRTIRRDDPDRAAAKNWEFWTAVIAGVNVLQLWLFFHLRNAQLVQFWITVAIHSIACIGPFWMLAHWFIRRRSKLQWQRWMWLFFVPWGFLWYVFEKWEPAESDLLRVGR